MSLISSELAHKLGLAADGNHLGHALMGAGQFALAQVGSVVHQVRIGSRKVHVTRSVRFIIIEGIVVPVILGVDWLDATGATHCNADRTLSFPEIDGSQRSMTYEMKLAGFTHSH